MAKTRCTMLLLWAVPAMLQAQNVLNISGTVLDNNNEPMIGVSVVVKGTTSGTSTGINGEYDIQAPADGTLVFSFIGMGKKEEPVNGRGRIDVVLNENTQAIDEVVVTALGIKRAEKSLSYNVQKVGGDEVSTVKSANFMNALAGKVAGVNISNSASGPGAAVKVVMRGAKSLSKNNNALYVIDGIPMYNSTHGNDANGLFDTPSGSEGAADINPDDIESITLLTGPSAAALYGYEGANGVVLVTTKKGSAEKTTVVVSNNSTFSTPLMMPEFQNIYGAAGTNWNSGSWGNATNVRYDPAAFFNLGYNTSTSVSLSTGNDRSQSYISAAANNAAGILPNNDYDRYNVAFRNTTSFFKNKFVLNTSADYIKQSNKNMVSQGTYFNPLPALYLFPRSENFEEVKNFEIYNEKKGFYEQSWKYGDMGFTAQNPYWIMNRMNRESAKNRYKLAASLQFNITDGFNIIGRANIDNSTYLNTNKFYAGTLPTLAGAKGRFKYENREERQTYADVIANFNKTVSDFTIGINAGASIKDTRVTDNSIDGHLDKLTNFFVIGNINREQSYKTYQYGLTQQSQSVFANAEIGWKNMIYLTLTGRNDWDSALAFSEEQSFFYPSVGLSALISEMITMPAWLSLAKVRLSYTSVGTAYDAYITREKYEYDDQTNQFQTEPKYPVRNLKPELTNAYEAGINLKFWGNMLNFDITWYRTNTLNQTFEMTLSPTSGYKTAYVQAGDVQNTGIELALGVNKTWRKFTWNSNLTYAYNNNVIKNLANGVINPVTNEPIEMNFLDKDQLGSANAPRVRLVKDGSMGDIYVNREWKRNADGSLALTGGKPSLVTGTYKIQDDGTYKLTQDYKKVGTLLADFNAGWRNSFSYAGITLNVLLSGRFGGVVVSNTQAALDSYGVSKYSAQLRESNGIVVEGVTLSAKDYFNIVAPSGKGEADFYVYDATNIRLAEVSLEYTLPRKWTKDIADITLGLVGNNLAMLYCKAPFDPELAASATSTFYTGVDYFMMPSLRNLGFSVKLTF